MAYYRRRTLTPPRNRAIVSRHTVASHSRGGFSKPIVSSSTGKSISGTSNMYGYRRSYSRVTTSPPSASSSPSVSDEIGELTSHQARAELREAVYEATNLWCLQAYFRDVRIYAANATGGAGCLRGPDFDDILSTTAAFASATGRAEDIADAVAEGIGSCFETWRRNVTVPGLPWYPPFAAFPGPSAPPMPNVPTPLASCISMESGRIGSTGYMKNACYNALPNELKRGETNLMFTLLESELALHFSSWMASQAVMNVMGYGPVPSFKPPFSPIGAVWGGSIIGQPGHLAS